MVRRRLLAALVATLGLAALLLWLWLPSPGPGAAVVTREVPEPAATTTDVALESTAERSSPMAIEPVAGEPTSTSPPEAAGAAARAEFHGVVLDEDTGAPIAGASISVVEPPAGPFDPSAPPAPPTAVHADDLGRFVLPRPATGTRWAEVRAAHRGGAFVPVVQGFEDPARPYEVRLARAAALDVRVRDASGPVGGLGVELTTPWWSIQTSASFAFGGFQPSDPRYRGITDAGGRVLLEDLPPRVPLHVRILRDRVVRDEATPVQLDPGEVRALDLSLGSGAVVRGRLTSRDGSPIAGHAIWRAAAEQPRARVFPRYQDDVVVAVTDAEGRYRFDDVPAGAWNVGPSPMSDASGRGRSLAPFAGLAPLVDVPAGGGEFEIDLVVDHGLHLVGRVLLPDGGPAQRSHVLASLYDSSTWAYLNGDVDAQGRFRIGPLVPGEWTLVAMVPPKEPFASSEELRVAAGTEGIELRLRRAGGAAGRVFEAQTKRPRAADLFLSESSGSTRILRTEDGSFSFLGLLPGSYVLAARTEDGLVGRRSLSIEEGAEVQLEIEVAPGARLVLRYLGEHAHSSYRIVAGGEQVAVGNVAKDAREIVVVPAEPLEVRWTELDPRYEESTQVALALGEERELVWRGSP
jgi:protocatechuate 3,4-dioxygenase beta subunit